MFREALIHLLTYNPQLYKVYKKLFRTTEVKAYQTLLTQFAAIDNTNSEDQKKQNDEALLNLISHAYKTVPYYKDLFEEFDITPNSIAEFKRIPILSKNIIKEHCQELRSTTYSEKELIPRFTGGSTGQPMKFYTDAWGPKIDTAQHEYLYNLIDNSSHPLILSLVSLDLPDQKIKNAIYWEKNRRKGKTYGDWILSSKYLNPLTAPTYIKFINKIQPTLLRGYPSAVHKLALSILQDNLLLTKIPSGIILTSELCTPVQRSDIEKAFKCEVTMEYGHKEISVFCYTPKGEDEYISSPLYCYTEVLNADGKDTPIGETGRIVTTGFCNSGMPFIRYDTGDLAEISYRNGGIIKLKKILGRSQDYLIDSSGKKRYLIGTLYGQALKAFDNIEIWQFCQSSPGIVKVKVVRKQAYGDEDEKELKGILEQFSKFKFDFEYVESIPKTKIGKHLFVNRTF